MCMEIYEDWLGCICVVHLPPVTDSKLEVKPPLMSTLLFLSLAPPPSPTKNLKKGGEGGGGSAGSNCFFSRSKIKEPVYTSEQIEAEALRGDFGRSKIHSLILSRSLIYT